MGVARIQRVIGAAPDRRGYGVASAEVEVENGVTNLFFGGVTRSFDDEGMAKLIDLLTEAREEMRQQRLRMTAETDEVP